MQYHTSSNAYYDSYVKTTVDAWAIVKAPGASEARLITIDEVTSFGYEWGQKCDTCTLGWIKTDDVPTWLYNSSYMYWTMSPKEDSKSGVGT